VKRHIRVTTIHIVPSTYAKITYGGLETTSIPVSGQMQIGAFEGVGALIKRSVLRAQRRAYVFLNE
jgi:hypothetical protein